MSAPVRLHPDDIVALADAIVTRLRAADVLIGASSGTAIRAPEPPRLLTAREVAERYGVSPEWVRDNADRLGVIRLGDGSKPRLRFDPAAVAAALTVRKSRRSSEALNAPRGGGSRRRAAREVAGAVGLLPFDTFNSPNFDKSGGRRANGPAPAHGGTTP